jgi:hypothetical protein
MQMDIKNRRWVKFDATIDYNGQPCGTAIFDAYLVTGVIEMVISPLSIAKTLLAAHKQRIECVSVNLEDGSSYYILWDIESVLKALGIQEAKSE